MSGSCVRPTRDARDCKGRQATESLEMLWKRTEARPSDFDLDRCEITAAPLQGVRVWFMPIAEVLEQPNGLRCLARDERSHADSYRRAGDRDRFLAARILLRESLSTVVQGRILPSEWRFGAGPNGKPKLQPDLPSIEFNLSHADKCAAVGISLLGPIGIDIESLSMVDDASLVPDALSDREQLMLNRCADRQSGFIRVWTLKEACAKAVGLGATLDFRTIEIGLDPPSFLNAKDLLRDGEEVALATMTIFRESTAYCLSLAALTSEQCIV